MADRLATPIAIYIAAFAEDAVVRDEGRTINGLAAIKRWKAATKEKYQHTVEPLRSAREGDKIVRSDT